MWSLHVPQLRMVRQQAGAKLRVLGVVLTTMIALPNMSTIPAKVSSSAGLSWQKEGVSPRQTPFWILRGGQANSESNDKFSKDHVMNLVDPAVRQCVQNLHSTETEYEKIYKEHCDRIYELERKLGEQSKMLFKKRNEHIRKIPDFWSLTLTAHKDIKRAISNLDMEVLSYLEDIEVTFLAPPKRGFTLHFLFRQNPFFDHRELTKTYELGAGASLTPKLLSVESTPEVIQWKQEDPSRFQVAVTKDGQTERIMKERPSFFHWFTSIDVSNSELVGTKMPEEKLRRALREAIAADCGLAYAIKDDILPHAVKYYTGEADALVDEQNEDTPPHKMVLEKGATLQNLNNYEVGSTTPGT